ncbi:prolyl oligopeptidase family protein [Angustibacter sp. Root456]|uniref:prolyl oligopeptidase family serine peptidase n=1 Tax=Angustibacter sp. Root456 TaxID=1736539 RepID=UPI0006FB87D6|nr:prolyl oligopeptidase family serine peptidase [Angustibacter sp. Root456]KQX65769.1 peptidase S9 [Angustibacter sp. Root456]
MPSPAQPDSNCYPEAARSGLVERLPADAPTYDVADPYRWLEDADSEATRTWSQAQDQLFADQRAGWTMREHFRSRVTRLLEAGVVGSPAWRGERQFLMRRVAGQEHAVLLTVDADGTERVLLDPMAIDPSGATTLDSWQPSKEGDLLAYQLSEGGREESVLRVMDVDTGDVLDGPIDRLRYSPVAWLPGGKAFYYVRRIDTAHLPADEQQYHRRVWLHRLGTSSDHDVLVFGEGLAKTNYYGVSVSMDGRWLTVSAAEGTAPRNDVWLADLQESSLEQPALTVVQQGVDAQTSVHVGRDGRAYVLTDRDAPRGRLAVVDPSTPDAEHWTDLLAQDDVAVLEDYAVLDGPELAGPRLLASWTRHAVSEVTVHDLASGERLGEVPLPGVGSVGGLSERPEGGHEVWFGYTDSVTPSSVQRYDARTGATSTWATAPGAVEVPSVTTQQLVYRSKDGTEVHLLLVAGDRRPDRPRPTILYGYGGFGLPLTPGYSAGILAWVEAGGVYAVAGLRGGGEEGEDWHRAGMLATKQNVFDDFHAAAEFLVAEGWTTPEQLSISGGSNGGLLVGAAITQRPELFAAAVCSAPLLDMVRYELFGLGATWASEYGTAADPEQLGWLLGYSPYHHVHEGTRYPATLFTVFDGDTRVDPLHARKLAAALQHATSAPLDEAPVLVRREADVGHGGRAVSRSIELTSDTLAFAAHFTGLETSGAGAGR